MRPARALVLIFFAALGCATRAAQRDLVRGRTEAANGDTAQAEQTLREAIRLDPSLTAAWTALAAILYAQARFSDAIELLRRCPTGRDIEVRKQLGLSLERMDDPAGEAILESVTRERPQAFDAQLALGARYLHQRDYRRAAPALEAYLRYRQPAAAAGDDEIRAKWAFALLMNRDWAAAQREFERLLSVHPADVTSRLGLATALTAQENCRPAITLYERLLGLAYEQPSIYLNLGQCYRLVGRRADCARAAQLYLRARPDDPKARSLAAACP